MNELNKKIEVNVYCKSSVDEAIEIIKLKKHNRIKLITNGGVNLTGKRLIEETRKIVGSNFVALAFAQSIDHFNWISKMENVLFTNNTEAFRKFCVLKMDQNDVLGFVSYLENLHQIKFNINQNQLLNFPLVNQ